MKTIAIIMAGGSGERFWPLSRCAYPKQLLKLKDGDHMLNMAIRRISPLVKPEDIYILTVTALAEAIRAETPGLPPQNVIEEPVGKNTAACLTLASAMAAEKYGEDVVMIVLTADHFIHDEPAFTRDCTIAAKFAAVSDGLLTFGIRPNRPETGYGYVEVGASASTEHPIFHVDSFREKPDRATAEQFLRDGDFFWNSGMFVWRNTVFQDGLQKHLPAMHSMIPEMREALAKGEAGRERLAQAYDRIEKISIDVGLMERAEKVFVLRASFDWDDIGTWSSLFRILPKDKSGNAVFGNGIFLKSSDSLAYSIGEDPGQVSGEGKQRLVIGYNVDGIVIVSTPDAVLVLPSEDVQRLKDIVAYLRENDLEQYL